MVPDGYELREKVGVSEHGVVRRAWCPACQAAVAIKVVNLDTLVGEGEVDRLHTQTTLLSSISDEHVIRYHCSFVSKQELWIVMEYAAHGSCRLVMTGDDGTVQPLAEGHIATILSSATRGIAYLHARELAHRDIKAANILVHEDGRATIGDFASSRSMFATGDRKDLQTYAGTPHWMAPEVLEQTGRYDLQADIWSLGITAIELATGAVPLEGDPPLKVMHERLKSDPPSLPLGEAFSDDFREFVSMCLQRDPAARPTAAQLLDHRFFQRATSTSEIVDDVLRRLGPLEKRYAAAAARASAAVQRRTMVSGEASHPKELAEQQKPRFSFSFGDDSDEDVSPVPTESKATMDALGAHGISAVQKAVQFGGHTKYGSSSDLLSFAEDAELTTTPSSAVKQVLIPDSNGVVIAPSNVTVPGSPHIMAALAPHSQAVPNADPGYSANAGAGGTTGDAGGSQTHAARQLPVIVNLADSTSVPPSAGAASAGTDDLIQFDSPKEPLSPGIVSLVAADTPRPATEKRFSVTPLEEASAAVGDRGTAAATMVPVSPNSSVPALKLVPAPAPVPLTPSSSSNSTANSAGGDRATTSIGGMNAMNATSAMSAMPKQSSMDSMGSASATNATSALPRHSSAGSMGSTSGGVDTHPQESSAAVSPASSPTSQGQNGASRPAPSQQPTSQRLVKSGSRFSMSTITPTSSVDCDAFAEGAAGGGTEAVIVTPTRGPSSTHEDASLQGQEQRVDAELPQDIVQPLTIEDEQTLGRLLRQLQQRVALAANGHGAPASLPIDSKVQHEVDQATRKIMEVMELTRPRG